MKTFKGLPESYLNPASKNPKLLVHNEPLIFPDEMLPEEEAYIFPASMVIGSIFLAAIVLTIAGCFIPKTAHAYIYEKSIKTTMES